MVTTNKKLPKSPTDEAYNAHRLGGKNDNIGAFGQPVKCHESYKDIDREMIAQIVDWFALQNAGLTDPKQLKSGAWLARLSRMSSSTVSQVMSGKYPSSPTKFLRTMVSAIEDYDRKQEAGTGMRYVQNSVYRAIHNACQRATTCESFAIVSGYVGVGKTAAVKAYAALNDNVHVIEANPSMTASVLLDEIMSALKIGVHESFGRNRTMDARFMSIVYELRGSITTLIIDEAETVSHQCLHILRRLRDKAGVGIVLAGTEKLHALIAPEHGEFDQIRSRVVFWLPVIKSIKREDSDALAQAAFDMDDIADVPNDVLDALWGYSKGSARMLVENLIPAVRDYGLKQGHALEAELVHDIAQQVLNLQRGA